MESTNSFTIETHVLCEGLSDSELEAPFSEKTNRECVLNQVTGGEALISRVEEGEQTVLLHHSCKLVPLVFSEIDTSGVMCASVQQHNRARLSHGESVVHARPIQRASLAIVVRIGLHGEASHLNDVVVIAPSGIADIDVTREELSQEFEANTESTSSGDSLSGDNSSFSNSCTVSSENKSSRCIVELSKTVDGKIFLIDGGVLRDSKINLSDNLERVRLFIVVTISTNTEVKLSLRRVSFVSESSSQNRIRGGQLNVCEDVSGEAIVSFDLAVE